MDRHEEAVTDAQVCSLIGTAHLLQLATEKDPAYVKGYSRLGFALFQLGRYDEAVAVSFVRSPL